MDVWRRPHDLTMDMFYGFAALIVGPAVAAMAVAALLWRVVLMGVFYSDDGIMVRTFLRTKRLPWAQVAGFTRTAVGSPFRQDAILVLTHGGDPIRTPVQSATRVSRLFSSSLAARTLSLEAFEEALQELTAQLRLHHADT